MKKTVLALTVGFLLSGCASHKTDGFFITQEINKQVNNEIQFMSDEEQYGEADKWVFNPKSGYGDCEDYALTKQIRLFKAGINSSVKSCITNTGEAHAVLETEEGWYLDNRNNWLTKTPQCKLIKE